MKQPQITIVDYGIGNLHSLSRAFEHWGVKPVISEDPDVIARSDALVLPGVGAFAAGISGLKIRDLMEPVRSAALAGKPILGICLGAQLLMNYGYEFGTHKGLGIIPGKVVRFPESTDEKIPHVGWNTLTGSWSNTIFKSLKKPSVYFVHSYIFVPEKKEHILSTTQYGKIKFCSAVRKGKIYGCQFHPEKSGLAGLNIIKNFIEIIK